MAPLFFLFSLLPLTAVSDVVNLEPVIVEAKKNLRINPVQVTSGIGAKIIDPPKNELGIELSTLDRLVDSHYTLRDEEFWLESNEPSRRWHGQVGLDISGDQKIKGRIFGKISEALLRADIRHHRDHRNFSYVDNHHTPYFSGDDEEKELARKNDTTSASLRLEFGRLSSLIENDLHSENVFAGAELTGFRKYARYESTAGLVIGSFEFLPFSLFESRDFESLVDKPRNNKSEDLRFGLVSRYRSPWRSMFQFEMSGDLLTRNEEPKSFSRYEGKLTADHRWDTNRWFETYVRATYDLAYDQSNVSDLAIRRYPLFDFGAEMSSTKRYPFGIALRGRRYTILPTPIQTFGDGALLQAAPALEPNSGIRFSAGPWYQSKTANVELILFSEESENDFLMIATSPVTARTIGIGGIWARGAEAKGDLSYGPLSWKGNYIFQIPLNASTINWQRGKRIPGRPKHHFDTALEFFFKSYQLGCHYLFQSGEILDLGESWTKGDQHRVSPYIGYRKKNWGARLFAKNLLAGGGNQELEFQGSAGPNILEPEMVKREWGFSMEVLL